MIIRRVRLICAVSPALYPSAWNNWSFPFTVQIYVMSCHKAA